jgi:hypothetical protein
MMVLPKIIQQKNTGKIERKRQYEKRVKHMERKPKVERGVRCEHVPRQRKIKAVMGRRELKRKVRISLRQKSK